MDVWADKMFVYLQYASSAQQLQYQSNWCCYISFSFHALPGCAFSCYKSGKLLYKEEKKRSSKFYASQSHALTSDQYVFIIIQMPIYRSTNSLNYVQYSNTNKWFKLHIGHLNQQR